MPGSLTVLGAAVGELLKARKETIAVSESSAGGLINAALVAVPGASAYYLGGCVVYTAKGRVALLGLGKEDVTGMRSASVARPLSFRMKRSSRSSSTSQGSRGIAPMQPRSSQRLPRRHSSARPAVM